MTLIAGLRCSTGGVLICADREESTSSSKRSVEKILRIALRQAVFVIAGAGCSSILANTFARLADALKAADEENGNDLFKTHQDIINAVLRSIYGEFVWGQHEEEERKISLIISAAFRSPHSIPVLYGTDDDILYPEQLCAYAGIGEDLAYYFSDKLYHHTLTPKEVAFLAAFIFREVSRSVTGVGLGTDMRLLKEKNLAVVEIPVNKVKEIEDVVPSVADAIIKAWNNGVQIPDWLETAFL